MFSKNDKLTLTLINAKDINGNILPFNLKLPLNNKKCILPEDLVSIDVFEYQEGLVNEGNIAFSIYLGELTTTKNLIEKNNNIKIKVKKDLNISSLDSPICIQKLSNEIIVFAKTKEEDIVVKNQKQLNTVIKELSDNFNIINNSVTKIRKLSNKKSL